MQLLLLQIAVTAKRDVKAAPRRELLKKFGGPLTMDQYSSGRGFDLVTKPVSQVKYFVSKVDDKGAHRKKNGLFHTFLREQQLRSQNK